MVWLTALFVGLVEGLCRFLPVSVSGHMSIIVNLFGLNYSRDNNMFFDALMHLAAFGAIMVIYGRDFIPIISDTIAYAKTPIRDKNTERLPQNVRTAGMLGISCAPMLIALFFSKSISLLASKTAFCALAVVATGVMLWATCQVEEGKRSSKSMLVSTAIFVGLGTALASLPGMSMFAVVYSICVVNNFKESNAVRFAYMVMAPIYLLAGAFEILGALNSGVDWSLISMYLCGALVTFVTSYCSILFFKYIIDKRKLINVSLYLLALGVVSLILSLFM